jgi:hypothetical protein
MPGDIDPLRSILQRHAETTALPFGPILGALASEQILQSCTDAAVIALREPIVHGTHECIGVVEALDGACDFYRCVPCRLSLN